jgi:hypothetical protein
MSYDRVLPPVFARTHPVPTVATLLGAGIAGAVLWLYAVGSSSVQNLFDTIVSIDGLLFALFYAATQLVELAALRLTSALGCRSFPHFSSIVSPAESQRLRSLLQAPSGERPATHPPPGYSQPL